VLCFKLSELRISYVILSVIIIFKFVVYSILIAQYALYGLIFTVPISDYELPKIKSQGQ